MYVAGTNGILQNSPWVLILWIIVQAQVVAKEARRRAEREAEMRGMQEGLAQEREVEQKIRALLIEPTPAAAPYFGRRKVAWYDT